MSDNRLPIVHEWLEIVSELNRLQEYYKQYEQTGIVAALLILAKAVRGE